MIIIWLIYFEYLQVIVEIIMNNDDLHKFILILCNMEVICIIYIYIYKLNMKLYIIETIILLLYLIMIFYKDKIIMINIYILMFITYNIYYKYIIRASNVEMFFRIIIMILFIWYFSWWLSLSYLDKKFYIYTFFKYLIIFIQLTEFKDFNEIILWIILKIIAWIYPEDFY